MNNLIGISGKIGSGKDTMGNIIQMLTQGIDSNTQIIEYVNGANITGFDYQIKKYADRLKDIVCLLIGCTREQLEDREFKEKELGEEWNWSKKIPVGNSGDYSLDHIVMTPRLLFQLLGTDCGRDIIHPNIWVNSLFADYEDNKSDWLSGLNSKWIITDVRFPNEAQAIKDRSGIVIRVNRDKQCGSCESTFTKGSECPNCGSGNWVHGKIDFTHPSETALDDYEFDHVIDNNGSIEELVEKVKQLNLV